MTSMNNFFGFFRLLLAVSGSVVAANEVLLDSVEDVEPHGCAEQFGAVFHLWVHVWSCHRGMTDIFGDVVGSHFGVVVLV